MIHRKTHPTLDEPDCFGCRLASVAIAASATPTRRGGAEAKANNDREKRWNADHAAYRRLVKDGTQPFTLEGAANLERAATSKAEIEHGLGAPADIYDHIGGDAA